MDFFSCCSWRVVLVLRHFSMFFANSGREWVSLNQTNRKNAGQMEKLFTIHKNTPMPHGTETIQEPPKTNYNEFPSISNINYWFVYGNAATIVCMCSLSINFKQHFFPFFYLTLLCLPLVKCSYVCITTTSVIDRWYGYNNRNNPKNINKLLVVNHCISLSELEWAKPFNKH